MLTAYPEICVAVDLLSLRLYFQTQIRAAVISGTEARADSEAWRLLLFGA